MDFEDLHTNDDANTRFQLITFSPLLPETL